jgi:hypothetical protein
MPLPVALFSLCSILVYEVSPSAAWLSSVSLDLFATRFLMLNLSPDEDRIISLHRYYCWTTLMKRDFEAALLKGEYLPTADQSPLLVPIKMIAGEYGMYMSYWYGGLYVVCEGWQELGLSDSTVDALLAHPNLQLLKRYRNGAFHYQKDYFDPRFMDFQAAQDSVPWVRNLSLALGGWFLAWYQARGSASTADPLLSHPPEV